MKHNLYNQGIRLIRRWCKDHSFKMPETYIVSKSNWCFGACAFYRPMIRRRLKRAMEKQFQTVIHDGPGIFVCIDKCAPVAGESLSRNWSHPGSDIDRTPYGVLAHELGHHVDCQISKSRGTYTGDFSMLAVEKAMEKPITGYDENSGEVFAEWFRVYVTNPPLLKELRPKVYQFMEKHLRSINGSESHRRKKLHWKTNLGIAARPAERIVKNLEKKIAKSAKGKSLRQRVTEKTQKETV